jgi:hypothetical protein
MWTEWLVGWRRGFKELCWTRKHKILSKTFGVSIHETAFHDFSKGNITCFSHHRNLPKCITVFLLGKSLMHKSKVYALPRQKIIRAVSDVMFIFLVPCVCLINSSMTMGLKSQVVPWTEMF